jgi:ribosome-associated translation inhibitor RaiA
MQIQVNTDHSIKGSEGLVAYVTEAAESALSVFSEHITRVEVHLTDESGNKSHLNAFRCVMEARLEGRQPAAVTDHATTMNAAVEGAADKLARLIESTLGKLRDR